MPYKDPAAQAAYFKSYREKHKKRINAYSKVYYLDHSTTWYKRRRSNYYRTRYGITMEEFERMLFEQDNKCAICKQEFIKTPHVDHDHKTLKVRGLLCSNCNVGLGFIEIIDMKAVDEYLRRSNGTSK
jgi:hypothetical protein